MRPIFNLLKPTGDGKAIKNIDTILTIIDTIKMAGLMDRITLNMLSVIESKAVAPNRLDEFLRQKIEMVRERETKTRDGEGRAALDRTLIGADFDDTEEGDDETEEARGLPIESLSPKQIISNLSDVVSAKPFYGYERNSEFSGKSCRCNKN